MVLSVDENTHGMFALLLQPLYYHAVDMIQIKGIEITLFLIDNIFVTTI